MISRWPTSKTKRAPQKVHPLPDKPSLTIIRPAPLALRRSVHPPVTQLRAIDLEPVPLRAERCAPKPRCPGGCADGNGLGGCAAHRVEPPRDYWADNPMQVAAPQPAGARFVVGALVRLTFAIDTTHCARRQKGREVVVYKTADNHGNLWVRDGRAGGGEYKEICVHWRDVEPLPSETPEGGDWVPPAPWIADADGDYGYGAKYMESAAKRRCAKDNGSVLWFDDSESKHRGGRAPTLAQACCAALGIQVTKALSFAIEAHDADGNALAVGADAESCARSALAALHARGMRP